MRPPAGSPPPPTSPSQIPSPSFAKRNLGKAYTPSPASKDPGSYRAPVQDQSQSQGQGQGRGQSYPFEVNILSPTLSSSHLGSPRSATSNRSNELSDVSSLSESGKEDSPAVR